MIAKNRLVDFIFDTFELAEKYDMDGQCGEAVGIRMALRRLAADFGISQAATDVAQRTARENAEIFQRALEARDAK